MAALVNEHRDVWLSGLRGDELSPADEATFQNLFMSARYAYASFYLTQQNLDALPPDWVSRKFAFQLFSNPGMRRIWNDRIAFDRDQSEAFGVTHIPTEFDEEILKLLADLDARQASPSDVKNYAVW